MNLYENAVRAAGVLEQNAAYNDIVDWIDSIHAECVEDVVHHKDAEIRELRRGASQEVERILEMLKDPATAYERLRTPTGSE